MNATTSEILETTSDPSGSSASSALQMQHRVLNFAAQIEQIQGQLDQLLLDIHTNNSQVSTLTAHLTAPQNMHPIHNQLSELMAQVDANQTSVETLGEGLSRALSQVQSTQGQLESIGTAIANGFSQVESRQGQIESLSHTITQSLAQAIRQEDLDSLATTLKKFSRTQFKANALGETKEQQIANAFAMVQEIATKRETIQERAANRDQEQLEAARSEARGALAAELLPALDSLELAIENGQMMVERQQQRAAAQRDRPPAFQPAPIVMPPKPPTFWQRLFQSSPQEYAPTLPPVPAQAPPQSPSPESLQESADDVGAWIEGLRLVRERFLGVLHWENIDPIPALNEPFDPRLHIAIEAVVRDDLPSQTVVRELRKGYRQGNRVLRYAEVVVAKGSTHQADENQFSENQFHQAQPSRFAEAPENAAVDGVVDMAGIDATDDNFSDPMPTLDVYEDVENNNIAYNETNAYNFEPGSIEPDPLGRDNNAVENSAVENSAVENNVLNQLEDRQEPLTTIYEQSKKG